MPPWVLRTLVLTAVYGVAQALFVALRSHAPDLLRLWSVLLLAVVVAVGIAWAGAEVILDRRPPEWTWFGAALVTAPAAGLLSWILLALFVDDTGVADLGPALFGRASFTALLILVSTFVGSRLGWLSLRRHGEGTDDPALDTDDEALEAEVARERAPRRTRETVGAGAPSARPRPSPRPRPAGPLDHPGAPTVAGVRTPSPRRDDPPGWFDDGAAAPAARAPAVEERDRMPEAARLSGHRRASTVRPATTPENPENPESPQTPESPFGTSDTSDTSGTDAEPESLEPPVVAVLPSFPMPGGPLDPETGATPRVEPADPADPSPGDTGGSENSGGGENSGGERPRRRFGLRRPSR